MRRRLIEYALVVLAAIIVSLLIIYFLFPRSETCTNCTVSMPQVRAECDKQFFSSGTRVRTLDSGQEHEFLVAFVDPTADPMSTGGGYDSTSGGYTTGQPAAPVSRVQGYVMVRVQPQIGYNYSGGSSSYGSSSFDTANIKPEQPWDDVTVTVARYVNPLRNDAVCGQTGVRFREGRFENYCEVPTRFSPDESPQQTYRIFVRNESSTPVEYCIVSNCDASAPFGAGTMCQIEQPPQP